MKKIELNILLAILVACTVSITAGTALGQKLLPPEEGRYQGAFVDFGDWGDEVDTFSILDYEEKVGRHLTWAYFSNHWKDGIIRFPIENVQKCEKAGVLPYIRMMPWSKLVEGNGVDPIFTHQKIIDGNWDDELRQWAQDAKSYTKPLMVEFGPEVNGNWFPWNGMWHGAEETSGYGDPNYPDGAERFRDAYRHIIDLFRDEGVTNITWLFHVDAHQKPDIHWNEMGLYYPGDEYIDWIGISVFGSQLPSHLWQSFSFKFGRRWEEFSAISKTKPLLLAEFAVIEKEGEPHYKANWLRDVFTTLANPQYDRIKAIAYWNTIGYLPDGSASMNVDTSNESLQVYRDHVSSSLYDNRPVFSDGTTTLPVKKGNLILLPTSVEVVGAYEENMSPETLLKIEHGDYDAAGKTYLDIFPSYYGAPEAILSLSSENIDLLNQLETTGMSYLELEIRGWSKQEQEWKFSLYHPGKNQWQIVGDNAAIESWEWSSIRVEIPDIVDYVSDGKILLKIASDDNRENLNVDYAAIKHFGLSIKPIRAIRP